MATITSLGTGSGLDLESIVTKLMTVEQQPLTDLSTKQAKLQSQVSAFGALQGTLSALQGAAQALSSASTFAAVSATLTDTSVMSASVSGGATAANYTISVGQLAQAQVLRSDTNYANTTDTFNTGSIALSVGGAVATNITIDSSNNTLSGIRDAINAANAGVSASIVNDGTTNRLLLSSNTTGLTAGAISVAVTDSGSGGTNALSGLDGASLLQTQEPLDAKFSINGLSVTRSSNTVSDAIDKVTFTLTKAGTIASPITTQLAVAKNTATTLATITSFVSAYNSVVKQIKSLSSYDATTNKAAVLTGDSTLRNIRSQLSNTLIGKVSGISGGISTLSDIGISLQKDGTLSADTNKLQAALTDTSKDVAGLFGSTTAGQTGIAVNFNNLMTSLVGTSGTLISRTDGINQSIKYITKQQTALSLHLTKIEANYRAQFSALDTTVASMQATSTYLTQQLTYLQSLATGVYGSSSKSN
jgi:flagellar hook-associated protein 2